MTLQVSQHWVVNRFFQKLLLIGLLTHPISTLAQSISLTEDREKITQAIDNYIVGWRHADHPLLERAFDFDVGMVVWLDRTSGDERMKSMLLSELAARCKPQKNYGLGYEIQNLDVVGGRIAIAKVKVPLKENHYIDYLELQKVRGDWKIVLKSFVYFDTQNNSK